MLYLQNGERIVTIDSVTSIHPAQGEVTSQNLLSRYDRHFVGKTLHNVRRNGQKFTVLLR